MTWAALIAVIIEFLGPALQAWLKELLERLKKPAEFLAPDEAAIAAVFAEARKGVNWWSFGRRATLRAAERVCRRRAGELVLAATGAVPVPQITLAEGLEIGRG